MAGQCDPRLPAGRPILTRRHYGWLTVGFLALVVYGSLVPLHFRFLPLNEAVARYRAALAEPVRFQSRSDWAANVLLFIPLSFLLMAALTVDRRRAAAWAVAPLVLLFCALLSAAIEFTQLYFPPRVTSLNDVVAESIGGLVGTTLWLLGGQGMTLWFRRFWVGLGGQGSTGSLLQAYIVFLVLVHAVPLDLTISPAELYRKYRQGRVRLVPWVGGPVSAFALIEKCLTNAAFFIPVGILLAGLAHPFWRRGRNWPVVLGLGLGLAGLIEGMQLFVYSRYCESLDVLTGGIGVLAGWGLGLLDHRLGVAPRVAAPVASPIVQPWSAAPWLLGGWLALLVFVNWQPFDFNLSLTGAASAANRACLVPFADYQTNDYLHAFDQISSKTVLFLPVGALLAAIGFGRQGRNAGLWVVVAAIALTSLLEAGQLFLPTRYASITDVLIETFGIWLGFFVGRRIGAAQGVPQQPSPGGRE